MHRKMTMETSDVIISELNRPWKFLAACLETLKISMEIAEVVLEYVFLRNTKSFLVKELPLLTLLNNVWRNLFRSCQQPRLELLQLFVRDYMQRTCAHL